MIIKFAKILDLWTAALVILDKQHNVVITICKHLPRTHTQKTRTSPHMVRVDI